MHITELPKHVCVADGHLVSATIKGSTASIVFALPYLYLVTLIFEDCILLLHNMYTYDMGDVCVSQTGELYEKTLKEGFEDYEVGTEVTNKYYCVDFNGVLGDAPELTIIAANVRIKTHSLRNKLMNLKLFRKKCY
jgi:hypothetical protein